MPQIDDRTTSLALLVDKQWTVAQSLVIAEYSAACKDRTGPERRGPARTEMGW